MPFANLLTGGGGNLSRILLLAGPGQPSFADTHGASTSSTIQQASLFAFAMSDGMQASFGTSLRTHGALGERFSFRSYLQAPPIYFTFALCIYISPITL